MESINTTRAERYRLEIEKAIDNAKRSAEDKWWRRQWHRAAGRRRRQELRLPVRQKIGTDRREDSVGSTTSANRPNAAGGEEND